MRASRPTHHMCPRKGCSNEVDNALFCCSGDWFALSNGTRATIAKTRHLPILAPDRRYAIERAWSEWDLVDKAEEANQ